MEVPSGFPSTLKSRFFSSAQTGLETALRAGSPHRGTECRQRLAVQLTERLSVAATMFIDDGFASGPFVSTSTMTNAFALPQYRATDRLKSRAGDALAENPIDGKVGNSIGHVTVPGGIKSAKYLQSQFAIVNHQRFAAGFGYADLITGLDEQKIIEAATGG